MEEAKLLEAAAGGSTDAGASTSTGKAKSAVEAPAPKPATAPLDPVIPPMPVAGPSHGPGYQSGLPRPQEAQGFMPGYGDSGMGFDSLFNGSGVSTLPDPGEDLPLTLQNEPFSADLSAAAFDPSEFWSFPTPSSTTNTALPTGPISSSMPFPTGPTPNYVWPTGFSPDITLPQFPSGLSNDSNPAEPIMAQFMSNKHSPATDMRLINALENQAAFIEGNPAEDKDLELFYYRFVRLVFLLAGLC